MALVASSSRGALRAGGAPGPALRTPIVVSRPALARGCVLPANQRLRKLTVHAAATSTPVKVIIQGRKLEVTDAIRTYVAEKLSRACEHFARVITKVEVTLSARGGDTGTHGPKEQKVEVTLRVLRNGVVRVEDSEESLYAAIDIVCDKVERRLVKVKEKAIEKGKWPGHAGPHRTDKLEDKEWKEYKQDLLDATQVFQEEKALEEQFAELNKVYPSTVRRTKTVELDFMTVEEAIDAMEAVGHSFFVFREVESDSIQIVYRRQAEGYGILVPRARA